MSNCNHWNCGKLQNNNSLHGTKSNQGHNELFLKFKIKKFTRLIKSHGNSWLLWTVSEERELVPIKKYASNKGTVHQWYMSIKDERITISGSHQPDTSTLYKLTL